MAGTFGFTSDSGIERDFHLVDGARVGIHRNGFGDSLFPLVGSLPEHPGDQIDIDLREADLPCPGISPANLRRAMGSAIDPEHLIVEMLDAETQPRYADLLDRLEFGLFERAGLALKSHLSGGFPCPVFVDAIDEPFHWALLRYEGVPPPK